MARQRSGLPLARMTTKSASPLRKAIDAHGHVLLYDGVCGLCHRFVQFLLRRDRGGTMRFATLQGALGTEARHLLPDLDGVDSVILLYREGAWVRSAAAIEAVRYLGGAWALAVVGYAVPRFLRDWVYDRVAGVRYRVFGRFEACPVPSTGERERFLD